MVLNHMLAPKVSVIALSKGTSDISVLHITPLHLTLLHACCHSLTGWKQLHTRVRMYDWDATELFMTDWSFADSVKPV